jgi:hypothetical protein
VPSASSGRDLVAGIAGIMAAARVRTAVVEKNFILMVTGVKRGDCWRTKAAVQALCTLCSFGGTLIHRDIPCARLQSVPSTN